MKIENKEMYTIRKFKSKRNQVFLVKSKSNEKYVLKKYRKRKFLEKEFEILRKLNKKEINVPEIIYKSNQYILLEYVKGETLLSFILKKEFLPGLYLALNIVLPFFNVTSLKEYPLKLIKYANNLS